MSSSQMDHYAEFTQMDHRSENLQLNNITRPPLPPIPINPEERIKELEGLLCDDSRKKDRINIEKVLRMYKDRELPDRTRSLLIVQNGEPVALNKLVLDGTPYWIEVLQSMHIPISVDRGF